MSRHVSVHAGVPAVPEAIRERNAIRISDLVTAAEHEPAVVRAARCVHDGQVRNEYVRTRHAGEFRQYGIAVNALWPRTVIQTAALQMIPGIKSEHCRTPEIMADAAYQVLVADAKTTTGNFFIDERC